MFSYSTYSLSVLMAKTRLHISTIVGRETKFLAVLQMLMSTLYTAAEFSFIPTGKLPHKSMKGYARIIWNSDLTEVSCDFQAL